MYFKLMIKYRHTQMHAHILLIFLNVYIKICFCSFRNSSDYTETNKCKKLKIGEEVCVLFWHA